MRIKEIFFMNFPSNRQFTNGVYSLIQRNDALYDLCRTNTAHKQ